MAFDFDLFPAKTQTVPASTSKFAAVHIPINAVFLTTMLALNKVTRLVRVPKGFVLTGLSLIIPDMDSGAALVFDIGDATTSGRLISASTKAQAGGNLASTDLVTAAMLTEFTANTDILWKTTTATTTTGTGTVKGILSGYVK